MYLHFRMEEFMTAYVRPQSIREFLDKILLPSVLVAYFVSLMQNLNASTAFFETFLFVAYHFLSNENSYCAIVLLFLEFACISILHVWGSYEILVCFIIGFILLGWKILYRYLRCHHPRIFVEKCMLLLIFKYVLTTSESMIILVSTVSVISTYLCGYRRKSCEDLFLFAFIAQILIYIAYSLEKLVGRAFFIGFDLALLLSWLIAKHQYSDYLDEE